MLRCGANSDDWRCCAKIARFFASNPTTSNEVSMPHLAARMSRAKPRAIMLIAEKARQLKAAGRDIISFSIGVPNFLPGPHVYDAARKALDNDSGQYGSNRGPEALLDAFIAHLEEGGLGGYKR